MKEFEEILRRVQQQLDRDALERDQKAQKQEEIRQRLENTARLAVRKYKEECSAKLPQAQEKVKGIIQPWFGALVQSGTYNKLLDWIKSQNAHDVRLSKNILYVWPDGALRGLHNIGTHQTKPYEYYAQYTVQHSTNYEEDVQRQENRDDEVWKAWFSLVNRKFNPRNGVVISRWPMLGANRAFAMGRSKSLEIEVDVRNIEGSLQSISPDVWIGFAEQIENGQVWENIEDSLKPKGPPRVISNDVYQAEQKIRRDEFLRKREEGI